MAGTNTPGGGSTGYIIAGITTVIFGTDGYLKTPSPGGSYAGTGFYIVESIDPSQDVEVIHGENGTGVKSWRVILTSGTRWSLVVQDDTGMPSLQAGLTVQLVDGAGLVPSNSGNNRAAVYTCTIVGSSERFQRKQAAMRTLEIENLTLVDSQ